MLARIMDSSHSKFRIVILTPKGLRTGGPEAMHQLHHAVRQLGKNSLLVPLPGTSNRISVQQYSKYDPIWGKIWHTRRNDIVIIPESLGQLPLWYFFFISRQNFFLWMLSVDFSYENQFQKYETKNFKIHPAWQKNEQKKFRLKNFKTQKLIMKFFAIAKLQYVKFRNKYMRSRINIDLNNYLFQSAYAREVFRAINDINLGVMLSDYTNFENKQKIRKPVFCTCTKKHIAYFPAKSLNLISLILDINASRGGLIHFIAIQGLEPSQVVALLSESDLFLDLGYFPGKDRLPREAISLNCPVLLAKRGATRFKEDFPLPNMYLLDLEKLDPESTFETITKVLSKGKKFNSRAQSKFQEAVCAEKPLFIKEVDNLIHLLNDF